MDAHPHQTNDPNRFQAEFLTCAVKPDQCPVSDRPEIAFAGRSNVGKSSLLNRVLGRRKLARTGRKPGRTQTINFFNVDDRFYFVDLPGYGYAEVPRAIRAAWGPMVENYLSAGRDIRAVVVLIDIRRDPKEEEFNLVAWLEREDILPVVVATKADKITRGKRPARLAAIRKSLGLISPPLAFSALTGEGRDDLWQIFLDLLIPEATEPEEEPAFPE